MAKEKFEQSKLKAPEEKVDLTTAEGRQKEIERISEEEIESEKLTLFESVEKLLAAADKQSEKIGAEIKEKSLWIREKIEKTASWYKKQPLWKKILFSAGCIGAASASAAVGGAVGTAVAAAAFTGSISQRLLGGIATFVTAEGLLKKAAEKGGRERTKTEAIRHTIEAATLGILVGSGSAARAVREISEATGVTDILRESYRFWFPSIVQSPEIVSFKPGVKEALLQSEAPVKTQLPIEYQGGKSIWQESGKQWEARFKEFTDLGGGDSKAAEALKTYNIDRIKDTVADAIKSGDKNLMGKYGLAGISDPDKLTVDQLKGIKWDNVFEDTLKEKGLVENLSSEQVENIVKNNATLREFFKEYPNAPRASENYENILKGKGITGESLATEAPSEMLVKTPIDTEGLLKQEVIPGDLKASYVVGFDQVFNKGETVEGLKNMFGSDIFGEAGIEGVLINRGDGVMIIKNAFGQKNFDLLLTDETIAVDGPAGWNWGSKGAFLGFGDRIPTEKLSPETIKTAKNYILESVKEFNKREALP